MDPAFRLTRRSLLKTLAFTGAAALPGARLALAAIGGDDRARLVLVILRGGWDGLAVVVPRGDPAYASARGALALTGEDGLHKLDDVFALHPHLGTLASWYGARQLLPVQAVATAYRERSHFDAQDLLEGGGTRPHELATGWLNRALTAKSPGSALVLGSALPLSARGDHPFETWAPDPLPDLDPVLVERLRELYAPDPLFAGVLERALGTEDMAGASGGDMTGPVRGATALRDLAEAAGRFLATPQGPAVAVLEAGGWDTHADQGTVKGPLASRLALLDGALGGLKSQAGKAWSRTLVAVVSEFGRTVKPNGSRGTDHGTATCALLAGGAVNGGRVLADWPGLGASALYEGRDLRPTTDLRGVLKGVLRDHLGVAAAPLDRTVFPGSERIAAADGLIATPLSRDSAAGRSSAWPDKSA